MRHWGQLATRVVLLATLCALSTAGMQRSEEQGEDGEDAEAIAAGRCPSRCDCSDGIERNYQCTTSNGTLDVRAGEVSGQAWVMVTCESAQALHCTDLPHVLLADARGEITTLSFDRCHLPPELTLCAKAFGAHIITELLLRDSPDILSSLKATHFGTFNDNIKTLRLTNAGSGAFPSAVIAKLRSLQRLTIKDVNLQLNSDALLDIGPLKYLEISRANLTNVDPRTFHTLSSLRTLALWSNKLTAVPAEVFEGLDALEELDISSNRIKNLDTRVFNSMPRLRIVRVNLNPLEDLAPSALEGLKQLEQLDMSDCGVELRVGARALAALESLLQLRLQACGVRALPPDTLQGARRLLRLFLGDNRLHVLPPQLFEDLESLKILDLSNNLITAISPSVLSGLKNLEELNLNDNLIKQLNGQEFVGLNKLRVLKMNNNELQDIAANVFYRTSELEVLELSNNSLTLRSADEYYEQPISPFGSLLRLRHLNLSHNQVSDIFDDWRYNILSLETLDLSYNNFDVLTFYDLNIIIANLTVNLKSNNISRISLSTDFLPQQNIEDGAEKRTTILIDDNPLVCDCELVGLVRRLIKGVPVQLEARLDPGNVKCAAPSELRDVLVTSLSPDRLVCDLLYPECPTTCNCTRYPGPNELHLDCVSLLSNLPSPDPYGLNSSVLTLQEPPATFNELPHHVRSLRLSNLNLTQVPDGPLPVSLKIINLSHNLLESVPKKILNSSLQVYLANNPIACNCWQTAATDDLIQHKKQILDYATMRCSNGDVLEDWQSSQCRATAAAAGGALLAVLGALAVVATFIYFRYREAIRIYLYARGWCSCCIPEELDTDKQFDAFISFSHLDEAFVANKLLPWLEEEPNSFKVCVHYREWIPGEMISVQIDRSITDSKRTIVVLSRNFTKSDWGQHEFRAAHAMSLREGRSRVVVILLDDVDEDMQLDDQLRTYLSTNTYVRWGDPWFWDKLYYALPRQRRRRTAARKRAALAQLASDGKLVPRQLPVVATDLEPRLPPLSAAAPASKLDLDPLSVLAPGGKLTPRPLPVAAPVALINDKLMQVLPDIKIPHKNI